MNNNQVKLLLGIHCHQPVDNFGYVIDDAVNKCYLPFMQAMANYPECKFSIHYSGWLLEYIYKNHKECFTLMKEAAARGSVEFFSGGYYEPVLASIPSSDRVDQIKKLNKFIKKHFKQEPKGLWLTERVWDNSIIPDLIKCGIEYVIVDDYHFFSAGFKEDQMCGYYTTEEGGESLKIFPINKELRYRIPFNPVDQVQSYLHTLLETHTNPAGIIFDDGEKFGVWPGTYKWVYTEKWIEKFAEMIQSDEKVAACTFADYVESEPSRGIAYLPTTSYYEMGEWSLGALDGVEMERLKGIAESSDPGADLGRFVKGGTWKNFFVKYDESNRLHKRILELSKVRKPLKNKEFEDQLFRAETNDVLWHGVFGGLYLPNLRDNAYKFIINAENIRYEDVKSDTLFVGDNNMDGYDELKAVNEKLIAVFDSRQGGQMTELDVREDSFNLQNTLTRRKEAYHYKMEQTTDDQHEEATEGIDTIHSMDFSKLEEYKAKLKFDFYVKNSFIDHVTDYGLNADNFEWCNFREYGDFLNQPYQLESEKNSATFTREGTIFGNNETFPASITKKLQFKKGKIEFDIRMESGCQYDLQYLLEFNFHFASLDQIRIDGERMGEQLFKEQATSLRIRDAYLKKTLTFTFAQPCNVMAYRLDTVSQSEGGFDLTNQGICLGFAVPFKNVFSISGSLSIGA